MARVRHCAVGFLSPHCCVSQEATKDLKDFELLDVWFKEIGPHSIIYEVGSCLCPD